jgi:hypothetical protein
VGHGRLWLIADLAEIPAIAQAVPPPPRLLVRPGDVPAPSTEEAAPLDDQWPVLDAYGLCHQGYFFLWGVLRGLDGMMLENAVDRLNPFVLSTDRTMLVPLGQEFVEALARLRPHDVALVAARWAHVLPAELLPPEGRNGLGDWLEQMARFARLACLQGRRVLELLS